MLARLFMAQLFFSSATTRSATSAVWALLAVAAAFAGCASAGSFASLPRDQRDEFDRCASFIATRLCHGGDPETAPGCLRIKGSVFARRRTGEKRRQWLETNGCPAATIAGAPPAPTVSTAAQEIEGTPPEESAPPPSASASPPTVESVAPAQPAPAAVASATPSATETEAAETSSLQPAGATCQRSADCASDLCAHGNCVTLAVLARDEGCAAAPRSPTALASPPRTKSNLALVSPRRSETTRAPAVEPAVAGAHAGLRQARARVTATPRGPRQGAPSSVAAAPLPPDPPSPRLPADRPAEEQLREAIVSHSADMKRCVERQLKRDPALRAEGTLILDVDQRGRVASSALKGTALEGTDLEGCLHALAARWRFPSAAHSYAIEAPIAVSGVEGSGP
jgi:hypothetical protein